MDLGKKISELRKQNGFSQEKLAELMGVSRQAVTKWESGKGSPDTENLMRLSEIFGISLDELCGKEPPEKPAAKIHPMGHILAAVSVLIVAAYCVIGAATGSFDGEILILLLILAFPMHVFLHLVFHGMIKSGEFSMLAGYDPDTKYDTEALKRYLAGLDFFLGMTTASYLFIIAATSLIVPQFDIIPILLGGYILSFLAGIFFMGYKFGKQIYLDPNDAELAKRYSVSSIILLVMILLSAAVFFLVFELKGYENNTLPALGLVGIMFLSIGFSLAAYFIEQRRLKKADEHAPLFGKAFIVLNIIAVLILVLMAVI